MESYTSLFASCSKELKNNVLKYLFPISSIDKSLLLGGRSHPRAIQICINLLFSRSKALGKIEQNAKQCFSDDGRCS
ncbi:hypothetical protein LguiA_029146 [Lonicera macranthoides]